MPATVHAAGAASVVTLMWPEKRNALGPEDSVMVADALARASEQATSAVILTGDGAFCAGGDLRRFAELSDQLPVAEIRDEVYGNVQRMIRALRACPVPTIAAVDGAAIGLGFDLALACDMRFVGPDGFLQQGWAKAGLIPGTGGVGLLRRVQPGNLWRLIASQERVGPKRAVELELAEAAEPTALDAAIARADQLATIEREVLGHYCALSRADSWPAPEHFDASADTQAELIGSAEFRSLSQGLLARRIKS